MRCQTPTESQRWPNPWAVLRAPGRWHGPEAPRDVGVPHVSPALRQQEDRHAVRWGIWVWGKGPPCSSLHDSFFVNNVVTSPWWQTKTPYGCAQANPAEMRWEGTSTPAAEATANVLVPNDHVLKPLSSGLPAASPFGLCVEPRMVGKSQKGQKLWEDNQMFNSKKLLILEA